MDWDRFVKKVGELEKLQAEKKLETYSINVEETAEVEIVSQEIK